MENEHSLVVTKYIDADRSRVYRALTDPQVMERWFFAGPDGWSATITGEPEVGKSFQIEMHGPDNTYAHVGFYREVVDNEKLVFSWNSQAVEGSLVTITLSDKNGGTHVKLEHDFLPNETEVEKHTEGWTAILERLEGTAVSETAA